MTVSPAQYRLGRRGSGYRNTSTLPPRDSHAKADSAPMHAKPKAIISDQKGKNKAMPLMKMTSASPRRSGKITSNRAPTRSTIEAATR